MKLLILDTLDKNLYSTICLNTFRLYILASSHPYKVGNRYDIDPSKEPLRLATLAPAQKN